MNVRIYVCTYVRMYDVRMYACTFVRTYVCMYVRMDICVYVRTYVCMYKMCVSVRACGSVLITYIYSLTYLYF
jgi:hypothetical protein